LYALDNHLLVVAKDAQKLAALQSQYPGIDTFACDLAEAEAPEALRLYVEQQHLRLNMLFNNAAVQYNYDFSSEKDILAKIDQEISVNLTAAFKLCAVLLRRNGQAAIVNISSGLAIAPKKSASIYCATKAALHSFSKALRYQLEASSIRVVEVLPPIVATPMTEGRGKGKISPAQVAEEFIRAFERQQEEIYIGKSKLLKWIHRLAPSLAYRILKNG
jgi:short-subunit dehydrogenase involved in D-alanine esterification of teichoic acids